jgi:hypothetical protein
MLTDKEEVMIERLEDIGVIDWFETNYDEANTLRGLVKKGLVDEHPMAEGLYGYGEWTLKGD